jgi:hypothetical protein
MGGAQVNVCAAAARQRCEASSLAGMDGGNATRSMDWRYGGPCCATSTCGCLQIWTSGPSLLEEGPISLGGIVSGNNSDSRTIVLSATLAFASYNAMMEGQLLTGELFACDR